MDPANRPEKLIEVVAQMDSLRERSIVVTGGGTGIGAACALLAAREGAAVTICGRREDRLTRTVREAALAGCSMHHVVADVTDEEAVEALVSAATEFGSGLHGVVASAGGGGTLAPYHRQSVQEFVQVLHLNVLGTMLLVKHTIPHLIRAGSGSFIGMSSIAALATHPYFGAYPVAKAAIEQIMRNAADEYGAAQVRFNAIRPGFITTEIMEDIGSDPEIYASYIENTPMGGVGQPDDVALLARFLLSDESRWITGQAISVDGGHCLRRGPDFSSYVEPVVGRADLFGPETHDR
jgi:NAD(P)-dependent dehydrogenase (short-subunit alcohol dehydrogenase family)